TEDRTLSQIVALGFQIGVSGLRSITSARHQTNGSGFTTSIRTENQRAKHVRQEHNANIMCLNAKNRGPVHFSVRKRKYLVAGH
ncbi:MAG: hypothetical protein ACI9BH_002652, partial [Paracoccaceae bacterium]